MGQIFSEMAAMGFVSLFFIIPALLLVHRKLTIKTSDAAISDQAKKSLVKHYDSGIALFSGAAVFVIIISTLVLIHSMN